MTSESNSCAKPSGTAEEVETCGLNTSNTAGPWSHRNIDVAQTLVNDYVAAKKNKATCDTLFKQAENALRYARSEGLLEDHFDELAEVYEFPGVTFSVVRRETYPMSAFSAELQAMVKAEKEDGTARPTVSEFLRAKVD
jgi:putative NIF3 family GTP cyclohydrolase 1 type 2